MLVCIRRLPMLRAVVEPVRLGCTSLFVQQLATVVTCGQSFLHHTTSWTSHTACGVSYSSAAEPRTMEQPAAIQDLLLYKDPESLKAHVERAWEHFRSLGSPQYHVAPMVDQSELTFRMLARSYGATAAYTPMLHARLFLENEGYRAEHFTTCPGDRPLFIQFCANDPDTLVGAAALVQHECDYIDLNLGCPQRIAKRGHYGAFLMDHQPTVAALVAAAASRLTTPVSCKIRLFPQLQDTISYAQMLQAAGCSLLAVHGRTREQKDAAAHRADWAAIAAVRAAVDIPVLANGDVTSTGDAARLMAATGAQGVLSAEPLLVNPALFGGEEALAQVPPGKRGLVLAAEYLALAATHPPHLRMAKGHLHKMTGPWLAEFTDLRDTLQRGGRDLPGLVQLVEELTQRAEATGRDHAVPVLSERARKRAEAEAARAAAIAEQERESAALAALEGGQATGAAAVGGAEGQHGVPGEQQQQQQQEQQQQQVVCQQGPEQAAAAALKRVLGEAAASDEAQQPKQQRLAVQA